MPLARVSGLSSGVAHFQNTVRGPPVPRDLRRINIIIVTDEQPTNARGQKDGSTSERPATSVRIA